MQVKLQEQLEKLSRKMKLPVWVVGVGFILLLLAVVVFSITRIDQATAMPDEDGSFQTTVSGLDILLKLFVVVVLIYASLYVIGRMRGGSLTGSRQQIEIIASSRLSPRQAIHIVRIGAKTIVVGATDHHVSLLGEFAADTSAEDPFSIVLEQSMQVHDQDLDVRVSQ